LRLKLGEQMGEEIVVERAVDTSPPIRPYYEHAGITIYHGDCRTILPHLPKVDLVLTDPPYGIGRDGKPKSTSSHGGHKGYEFMGWDQSAPDRNTFSLVLKSATDHVIWGANYFSPYLPPGPGWLLWDKGQRIDQADGELAASSRKGPLRVTTINRVAIATDGAVHPTQKPLALMKWCLSFFPSAETAIDPFMGSGTTLVACKQAGIRCIGIEIEEKYCEVAARRLAQEVLF
jgi:site-specific DNA-methyltransferase (adenine-specific)